MKRPLIVLAMSAMLLPFAGCAGLVCVVGDLLANRGVASGPGVQQEVSNQVIKPRTENGALPWP